MTNDSNPIKRIGAFLRKRASRRSPPVTPEMVAQMKMMYFEQGMAQHEIAAHFHVNQGRVSTAINN